MLHQTIIIRGMFAQGAVRETMILVDTLATLSMSNYGHYSGIFEAIVVISALGGELTLCLWLLIKGIRN